MAKHLVLLILFINTLAFTTPLKAFSYALSSLNKFTSSSDICNAPAPDSFRIEYAGYNFVNLKWAPVWSGATYTIFVMLNDTNSSTMTTVGTFSNITGSTFLVEDLQYEYANYSFSISTNCPNGEISVEKNVITPPIGVILDLTIAGFSPVNPSQIAQCTPTKIGSYNWIGFEVYENQGLNPPKNFFQVFWAIDHAVVKRVIYNPIVAGTNENDYPQNSPLDHIYFLFGNSNDVTFKVFKIGNEDDFKDIGWVRLLHTMSGSDHFLNFCIDTNVGPWNNNYSLRVIRANGTGTSGSFTSTIIENHPDQNSVVVNKNVIAKSPFDNNLSIILPEYYDTNEPILIQLMHIDGRIAFQKKVTVTNNQIDLNTSNLPLGIYALTVKTENFSKSLMILKL